MTGTDEDVDRIYQSDPVSLAELIRSCSGNEQWTSHDLELLWQDFLNLPVAVLGLDELVDIQMQSTGGSLGQLVSEQSLPLSLCEKYKTVGKHLARGENDNVPRELGSALYYLCIAAGMTRYDRRLTELSDNELISGFNWMLEQNWLDQATHQVITAAHQIVTHQDRSHGPA